MIYIMYMCIFNIILYYIILYHIRLYYIIFILYLPDIQNIFGTFGWKISRDQSFEMAIPSIEVGCEILHQKDGWKPINNGRNHHFQLVIWISQPSTVEFRTCPKWGRQSPGSIRRAGSWSERMVLLSGVPGDTDWCFFHTSWLITWWSWLSRVCWN